ncbi:hypothetical protein M0805_003150 [Coniferiporia weirii]|nr:hypothetical protein M0805_003150 [Coniferiporia weirii]
MAESLSDVLASEARLINEAAEALPHQFDACTHSLGYIRQAVYLCLTCSLPRGICSACSIACHTDHEQVELFPKRHFRCDCPTSVLAHPCTLHNANEGENIENEYGHNFGGVFCRCGRPYDATKERETMIQCLACEDWFHESCLNLRERPPSRDPSPEREPPPEARDGEPTADNNADAVSEASSSGLPPPLITDTAYDSFICRSCVLANSTLRRWVGTKGAITVIRDATDAPWTVFDGASEDEVFRNADGAAGNKRTFEAAGDMSEESNTKRPRTESKVGDGTPETAKIECICLAPTRSEKAERILEAIYLEPANFEYGTGDVFLTEGWRMRWCHCENCLPALEAQPFLLAEEETYEPPEDPDSAFSLEELGMRALQSLPRDRALDGIRAFNEMRDELLHYLRPFAQEGKVVNEADVRRFFEEKQEARRATRE